MNGKIHVFLPYHNEVEEPEQLECLMMDIGDPGILKSIADLLVKQSGVLLHSGEHELAKQCFDGAADILSKLDKYGLGGIF